MKRSINKSALVRSYPRTMSASEIVEAVKKKGVTLSEKYVHTIRYNAKQQAKKVARKQRAAARHGVKSSRAPSTVVPSTVVINNHAPQKLAGPVSNDPRELRKLTAALLLRFGTDAVRSAIDEVRTTLLKDL